MKDERSNRHAMPIAQFVVDAAALSVGGFLFLVIIVGSFLSGVAALLSLSDSDVRTFRRIVRSVSLSIVFLSFVLPFRSFSFAPVLLLVWWAALVWEFPRIGVRFVLLQLALFAALLVGYWAPVLWQSRDLMTLRIGDFAIFVLVPLTIALVYGSRGSETLGTVEPRLPVRRIMHGLWDTLETRFPM